MIRRELVRWILVPILAALLAVLTGCNVVAWQQARIEGKLRDAGMASADVRLGADTVHYWSGGHGPTVLLVHGFGASATWLWYPQVQDLAKDHHVILPDLLWFGDSKSDDHDFSLDHQVKMVEALLDKLGERQVDVVGVSYGGLVVHELASSRVKEVRSVVIVDSPARVYTLDDYRGACKRFGVTDFTQVLVPVNTAGIETVLGLAYYDPPWLPGFALDQTLNTLYGTFRDEHRSILETLLRNMAQVESRPVTLRARPLIVWGREDPVFPIAIGERLAYTLKAPLQVLEKARHAPNLEHPEEFNRILRSFLASGG
jgi:pimeloyl-ACP methyl ester carboxylesterase